ncbi:MAG TPA: hypothetical protein VF615_01890 [Longimicrobiaceae bacterium]
MTGREARAEVLRAHGATAAEAEELLAYTEPAFRVPDDPGGPFPLPDEPWVAAWEGYAAEAEARGAWPVLRERLVQLRFPVAEGISATEAYRAATRRGEASWPAAGGVELRAPERLRLLLHPTAAGRVPVLVAGCRDDFVALVRALARRGEPDPVPPSMGACIVGGLVNWDRVAALRRAWQAEHPGDDGGGWAAEMRALAPRKELYQDRFVLLGRGPYSGVPAAAMGMAEEEWEEVSLTIRLEHECAHHFTRRVFGSMRNTVHDELLADFAGVVSACGRFRADWVLRFLGVEDFPRFRPDGRLRSYRGDPPLGDGAFRVLQSVARGAAAALEEAAPERALDWRDPAARARILAALARLTVEEMAAPGGAARLAAAVRAPRDRLVHDKLDCEHAGV